MDLGDYSYTFRRLVPAHRNTVMSDNTEATMLPDITFTGTNGNECEAFIVAIRDLAFAQGRDEDHHWMLRFATTRLRGKALRWHARLEPSIKQDWDLFVQALFEEYSFVEESGGLEIATPVRSATTFSSGLSTISLPTITEKNPNFISQSPPLGISGVQPGYSHSQASYFSNQHTYPVRQYDPSTQGQQIGLLRIVNDEGSCIPQYIWWGYSVDEMKTLMGTCDGPFPARTTVNRHEALVVSFLPSIGPHEIVCLRTQNQN